ncbi:F-box domain-containing protein [Naegleria gruberi]|uniref:F-box domain-containing protein n=1 Tax=Naegleria gruberi TaxID=5762 RepID=D2V3S7_NAEGR|nr:F-box domain-containing protein [Naegleria gruberi]EFC48249.1 F-box domain-containing protein [Naegleria gruberi]|eukprot:XP_002680993.1 F-box domain-containing protein [Naegleria gruberi strain NEG-M]
MLSLSNSENQTRSLEKILDQVDDIDDDKNNDRGIIEGYTPFIIDCSKFSSLPDELLIEIFQYVGVNPFEMMSLSHTCRQWKELINSQFRVWQYVPLTISRSKIVRGTKDEVGHLLLKYFDRFSPVYYKNPKYAKVYKQFDVQYEKYIRDKVYENKIKESEVPALLKAFKKPIIVSTDQFIDFLKHVKKEKLSAERLRKTRDYFDSISSNVSKWTVRGYLLLLMALLINICVSMGLFGETPEADRSLDKGLWWLPWSFVPMHAIIIYSYIVVAGLAVNESFKFKSRSEIGVMAIFFLVLSVLTWIFTSFKYDMYEKAGVELSYWQNRLFPQVHLLYLLPFIIISGIGTIIPASETFFQHFYRTNKFPFFSANIPWASLDRDKLTVFATFLLCEFSLLGFSFFGEKLGSKYSFIPMILGGILGGIQAIKYNYNRSDTTSQMFSVLPIFGSIAVGCLAYQSFNYWSFIPLTLGVGAIIGYGLIKKDL